MLFHTVADPRSRFRGGNCDWKEGNANGPRPAIETEATRRLRGASERTVNGLIRKACVFAPE